jgi:hypothetical protein
MILEHAEAGDSRKSNIAYSQAIPSHQHRGPTMKLIIASDKQAGSGKGYRVFELADAKVETLRPRGSARSSTGRRLLVAVLQIGDHIIRFVPLRRPEHGGLLHLLWWRQCRRVGSANSPLQKLMQIMAERAICWAL